MLPEGHSSDIPWLEALPRVRGRYSFGTTMATQTWFKVGGPAAVIFKPADVKDLQDFLRHLPRQIPLFPLGVGSNILVRDGGIRGVVIRLGRGFSQVIPQGNTRIMAGAGALDRTVAQTACQAGIAGLSFLSGIPGTIGGALRMNAGAYGSETKDVLVWADVLDRDGGHHRLEAAEMGFGYRHCGVPEDWIFIDSLWEGTPGKSDDIAQSIMAIQQQRDKTQPVKGRTGGSTFANPPGHKAWELIDRVGLRGMSIGDAQFSDLHCNFMINRGHATAHDLETLGDLARQKVLAATGIDLPWEIKRLGDYTKSQI